MYAQIEKSKVNKSRAVADSVAQKKSRVKLGLGFVDNRIESIVQRKLQKFADNNQQVDNYKLNPFQLARQEYKTVVEKPSGFVKNPWPISLSSGGKKADSKIASKVNETLADMGWGTKVNLMSAHMIPKRLGGKGNNSNVRPWPDTFESGKWENQMENEFDDKLDQLSVGDELQYKVITNDLEEEEAKKVLKDAEYKETDLDFNMHKNRLKKIPKDVEGVIGVMSVGVFDDTWPIK